MRFSVGSFEIVDAPVVLGVITGMTYGVLAVALVLVHRTTHVVNFALGAVGAFGAAFLGLAVVEWGLPYWLAFPFAVAVAGAASATSEVVVVRRLRGAPGLMTMVATLGVGQVLILASLVVDSSIGAGATFPQPPFLPEFDVGALRVTRPYFGMLVLTPVLVLGLALFLRRSRFGLAMRGAADNPDAARLVGVFASRMSTLSWGVAGAVAAFTAILVLPTQGFTSPEALGPALLLRALVPAVIARMSSLPVALLAGIGVGVVEQTLLWNYPSGGFVEMLLFVVVLVGLLVQPGGGGRSEDRGSWAVVRPWPRLPDTWRAVPAIRHLAWIVGVPLGVVAVLLPAFVSNSTAVVLVAIVGFAIVGLSVGIITGLGGQLSLGQFALAGIGATASYRATAATGNVSLGLLAAGAAAAAVSVLIGLPALRIRGLMLAVTTLSFALMSEVWLFKQPWMLGSGAHPGTPQIGSIAFDSGRSYYWFALFFLLVCLVISRNFWRSGLARRLVALRDNEDGARAFGIPATVVKLQGFAVSGFLAGVGGAVMAHSLTSISASTFVSSSSVNAVAMSVLGGIGLVIGPVLGALYITGLPRFLPLDSAELAATSLGWLLLVLYYPGGIPQALRPARERIVSFLARRAGVAPDAGRWADGDGAGDGGLPSAGFAPRQVPAAPRVAGGNGDGDDGAEVPVLEVRELGKRFDGLTAVDRMSVAVRPYETLGLIGPNGAGKTTLFELIGGFTRADSGVVLLDGRDITGLSPERRARLGLIRSFQDAALFPTMTVLEAVTVALERTMPTRFGPAIVGLRRAERARKQRARELVDLMGLDRYRDRQVGELSTGTRRIAELACLVALEPRVLLLDEPSAGIAQRETEALAQVIVRMKAALGATVVLIEHDMPMVMGLADRIVVMEAGRLLAEGSPEEVRNDPTVVEAYLGGDLVAIERSDRPVTSAAASSSSQPG